MAKDTPKIISNLSRAELELLHSTLKTLLQSIEQSGTSAVRWPDTGICANWGALLRGSNALFHWTKKGYFLSSTGMAIHIIMHVGGSWRYSRTPGCYSAFPVPEKRALAPWEGTNLDLRIDLMRYTLKRLRDWKRRAKK